MIKMKYCFIKVKIVFLLIISLLIGCGSSDHDKDYNSDSGASSYFTDVTNRAKLNFLHDPGVDGSYFMPESIGSGGAFLDYDNDGDLDIYLVNGARHDREKTNAPPLRNQLFRQESDGTFVNATEGSGIGDTGYGMGVAVGDIDNDGDVDVYVSNYGADALYRNNGDGTFTDISKLAGISNPDWGCSVIFFDYNLDDFLDLYVTNYVAYNTATHCMDKAGRRDYCGPAGFSGVSDVLYHNNGDGTFTDVSIQSGIADGQSKGLGVVSTDFNGDNYPDLYVANDGVPNHLWINQHDGTFRDNALQMGAALNEHGRAEASMGIALGDIDNDEDLDLFIGHLASESNTLYQNTGQSGFQDYSALSGLAGRSIPYTSFGNGFFDFDHDGDLDLAIVNGRIKRGRLLTNNNPSHWDYYAEPNFLFENDGLGNFREVSDNAPSFCNSIKNSRGLAFGDVDNDGDIDLLVMNEGGNVQLFLNEVNGREHWLIIRAINPKLNRDAIGATITVLADGKRISRLIAPGYSFLSSNDPRVHFGLGAAKAVDQIIVRWLDGTEETFPGLNTDQIITLKKGSSN